MPTLCCFSVLKQPLAFQPHLCPVVQGLEVAAVKAGSSHSAHSPLGGIKRGKTHKKRWVQEGGEKKEITSFEAHQKAFVQLRRDLRQQQSKLEQPSRGQREWRRISLKDSGAEKRQSIRPAASLGDFLRRLKTSLGAPVQGAGMIRVRALGRRWMKGKMCDGRS